MKEQREWTSKNLIKEIVANPWVSLQKKHKFKPRHVLNYHCNYNQRIIDNEGAAPPLECEDSKVSIGPDSKPKLDADVIDCHENSTPGSGEYWKNLIRIYEMSTRVIMKVENAPDKQVIRIQEIVKRCRDVDKWQHELYTAQCKAHNMHKAAKENQKMASFLFKNHVLHAGFVTTQQNAANFHAFTTGFCRNYNQRDQRGRL